ncbi:MAG: CRISPR-associated CARF protein Csa3 [Candidatus Nezhaarchaeales archaeon]
MTEPLDALIMTLGFEPGPLIRAVASHNLKPGSSIIILTPVFDGKREERGERAYLELERICSMMLGEANITVKRVDIELTDLTLAINQVKELLSNYVLKYVAISLSGGMRALCLATYIAYLLVKWEKTPLIEIQLEGRAESLEVPPLHTILTLDISEERKNILKVLLEKGPLTIADIAPLVQKDRSTVYRHLTSLTKLNLVQQRGRFYELTSLGKIIAK